MLSTRLTQKFAQVATTDFANTACGHRGYSMHSANVRHKNSQRGVSLIESLVAIVVMSLGILGILGVQMRTLADTQTSVRRAQAIRLIEDLSERMKVNPSALGSMASYTTAWNTTPTSPADCKTTACNNGQLAVYDMVQWKQSVKNTLPSADANVFVVADETDAANRRQLGVMISWRENERESTADYTNPLATATTGGANVSCPAGSTCHLQYVQLNARCAPYTLDATPQFFCPASKT